MNDKDDRLLRQLAEALVADSPAPPALDLERPRSYVDLRGIESSRSRRQVLTGVVAAAVLVLAGGVALVQGGSPLARSELDAASTPLVPTTGAAVPTVEPVVPLLDRRYGISRSSWDDPAQNTIVPIGADEVPAGVIGVDQALRAVPDASPCDRTAPVPPCDPPYASARLARYQGFGGYESSEDVLGPGASEVRHDVVVWVVVRSEADFALALSPGNHVMIGALLVDATSGELVGGGSLLPPE
jgi:hypothetical protein